MPVIAWEDSHNVGESEIDAGRQLLVCMVNDLQDMMKDGRGKDAVGSLLPRIVSHAHDLFAEESRIMMEAGFGGYECHVKEHEEFMQEMNRFTVLAEKSPVGLAVPVFGFLRKWLTSHVLDSDKKAGTSFMRKN